jgi:arylsulfatase A-like enzyme
MFSRRLFLKTASVAATALTAPNWLPAASNPTKPKYNVLFIPVDDLKPLLGCYGAPTIQTPNLDKLAQRGMVFEHAYCQQAVCSPSRSSLLTGCRPDTTKVWDLETHFRTALPDVVTLPQQFKAHGYHTQSLSKIYHNGFDDRPSWSVPSWFPRGPEYQMKENTEDIQKERQEAMRLSKMTAADAVKKIRGMPWESPDVSDDALPDGRTAAHAIEVLQQLKKSPAQPFFLATGFLKPHLPFVAPKRFFDLYPPEKLKLADNPYPPKDVPPMAMHTWGELRAYHGIPKKGPVTDQQAMELIRGYYAATSYCDAMIGRVLDELDRQGLRDNTIVVVWGDHGWHLGDHGLWCKHDNFESTTNAPLIVSIPGMSSAGQKTKALVEFVDIYPTLCELCGLPLPNTLEGTSFAPVLEDPTRDWKKAAFSHYPHGGFMGYTLGTQRYRYTEWLRRNNRSAPPAGIELYDHQSDPEENVNVAGRPENKELTAQLSQLLHKGWKAAVPA